MDQRLGGHPTAYALSRPGLPITDNRPLDDCCARAPIKKQQGGGDCLAGGDPGFLMSVPWACETA